MLIIVTNAREQKKSKSVMPIICFTKNRKPVMLNHINLAFT